MFSAVDHRIEALRLNAQHSSGDTNPAQNEGQSRVSRESSPLDEEDKDSGKEDTPSSPESTVESHSATFREKAVSLLSEDNGSGCEEGERGREEEGEAEEREEGEREPKQSDDSQETSSSRK